MNSKIRRNSSFYEIDIDGINVGLVTVTYHYGSEWYQNSNFITVELMIKKNITSLPNIVLAPNQKTYFEDIITTNSDSQAIKLSTKLIQNIVVNFIKFTITLTPIREVFNVLTKDSTNNYPFILIYDHRFKHNKQINNFLYNITIDFDFSVSDLDIITEAYNEVIKII